MRRLAGGQPVVAQLQLQQTFPRNATDPLRPLFQLLLAEASLAGGQDEPALNQLLNLDRWPGGLADIGSLRRADALAGLGKTEEALALYLALEAEGTLLDEQRFSCNRAAFIAFKAGRYKLANRLYKSIAGNPPQKIRSKTWCCSPSAPRHSRRVIRAGE